MNKVALLAIALLLVCTSSKSLNSEELGDGTPPKMPVYVGIGYNLITGNPLDKSVDAGFAYPIFKMNYSKSQTTTDGKFIVPDGVVNRVVSSCSFETSISEHRGTSSYVKSLSEKVEAKVGMSTAIFEASFSTSHAYENMVNNTINQKKSITHATAECEAYYLSIDIFKSFPLDSSFEFAVNKSFSENNWQNFILEYGTHFVHHVIMGGRAVQEIEYEQSSVSQLSSINVNISVAAKARYAMFFADAEYDWHKHTEEINYASSFSKDTLELYVGGRPPRDGKIGTWVQNVVTNPMPIRYQLVELTELFEKVSIQDVKINLAKVKSSFASALNAYCTKKGCKKPTPDLPKPAPSKVEVVQAQAVGKDTGTPFAYAITTPLVQLKQVNLRTGACIDNVQLLLSDGIKSTYTPQYGGQGGGAKTWAVPAGEQLSQVEYWNGKDSLSGFILITNKGTKSPLFGTNAGSYALVTFPSGYRVIGIHGKQGKYVFNFGFTLGKTIYPNGVGQPQMEIKNIELSSE